MQQYKEMRDEKLGQVLLFVIIRDLLYRVFDYTVYVH